MRAGFIEAPGVAYFIDNAPEPQLTSPNDVKIKVHSCGICGSEVHAYHGVHPFRVPPLVSGHEFAGEIAELGSNVTGFKIGDRVTAEPQYGCGTCWHCKRGLYNICPKKIVLGSKKPENDGWSGSLGEYVILPGEKLVRLADNVSYDEGALIEPIANAMYSARNTRITSEDTIVIIGAGPIGLGDLLCTKLYGPKQIIVTDVAEYNLKVATELGADHVIVNRGPNLKEEILKLTEGVGADITILAFGNEPVLQQAAEITRRGGTIVQHAMMKDGLKFPYELHQLGQIDFQAYNMYVYEDFALCADAIQSGRMQVKKLITQTYPIEEFKEAMYMADKRPEPVIKVMMHF